MSALTAVLMLQSVMFFGIGFLTVALSVPVVISLAHRRTARRSTHQPQGGPSSTTQAVPKTDILRAEIATSTQTLEANVEQLKTTISSRFGDLGKVRDLINRLRTEIDLQHGQLRANEEEIVSKTAAILGAERALSEKQSALAALRIELSDWSALSDTQRLEIAALKTEVEALKARLYLAGEEFNELAGRRDAERAELKTVTEELLQERNEFRTFHSRAAELVQQLEARTVEDTCRYQDLQNRLGEQSRRIKETESALERLIGELASARKVQSDMRLALSQSDSRADSASERFKADKAKLQSAFDRANSERMRLAYELASLKRLVALQIDNSDPRDITIGSEVRPRPTRGTEQPSVG